MHSCGGSQAHGTVGVGLWGVGPGGHGLPWGGPWVMWALLVVPKGHAAHGYLEFGQS